MLAYVHTLMSRCEYVSKLLNNTSFIAVTYARAFIKSRACSFLLYILIPKFKHFVKKTHRTNLTTIYKPAC